MVVVLSFEAHCVERSLRSAPRAVSQLDPRIEAATGHDVDTLWAHRDRGLLDATHAELVDRHRELGSAETSVTFHRTLLHRLSSGEYPVDTTLFERIDRTVDQLEEAADARDDAAQRVLAAPEPIEAAARSAPQSGEQQIAAADQATLPATASGTRIPYTHLQRLHSVGLVAIDTSHPVHAGQPVSLTDTGRVALAASRRPQTAQAPLPAQRPGAWPSTPAQRRRLANRQPA
ncbi:hypothetical protein [Streptomyces achromogenes]|uniref:hypothetical protein n=1 Tax=Streptomyces achromogenes TaxID=67255 RepID=UPI003A7FE010